MIRGSIYRIAVARSENIPLFYIGQTINFVERKAQHLRALRAGRHDNVRMQRTFVKYGEDAFSFSTILVCRADDMTPYEQIVLDHYIKSDGGRSVLNVMRECVRSHLGVKRRPESIEKLARAVRGKKRTPEQIAAMSLRQTGFRHSEETKRRMSESMKGKPQHPNTVVALTAARLLPLRLERLRSAIAGKPKIHSENTKQKIARSLTGRKQSAELIERRVSKMRGRKQSPEAISKRVSSRIANGKKMSAEAVARSLATRAANRNARLSQAGF